MYKFEDHSFKCIVTNPRLRLPFSSAAKIHRFHRFPSIILLLDHLFNIKLEIYQGGCYFGS